MDIRVDEWVGGLVVMYMNYEISVIPLFPLQQTQKISSAANKATLVVALLWIPSFGKGGVRNGRFFSFSYFLCFVIMMGGVVYA